MARYVIRRLDDGALFNGYKYHNFIMVSDWSEKHFGTARVVLFASKEIAENQIEDIEEECEAIPAAEL